MNRCWKGMSASNGVDPYLRAFSRYSAVFQGCRRTTPAHDHVSPGVDGADEVITQVGVDLKGYVHRGGTARHEEGVREDVPALVGPVVFVLHRVHDDQVEELEDGLFDALLDARGPALAQ